MTAIAAAAAPERARRPVPDRDARRARWIVASIVVACGAMLLATRSLPLAALPLLLYVAGVLLWRVPLRHALLAYVFVDQTAYILSRANRENDIIAWRSPLEPVFHFLWMNLSDTTGIAALRFSGAQFLYLVFLGVIALRALTGARVDAAGRRPAAWPLLPAVYLALGCIVWLEALGIARGGADVRQSLWQIQTLLGIPLLTTIFVFALRDADDLHPFAIAMTIAASVKAAIGLDYFFMARALGGTPESITSHPDSVLYVTVLFYWLSRWVHRRTIGRFVAALGIGGWMMVALAANNRRTAFVALAGGLLALYLMLEPAVRGRINRKLLWVLPFLPIYLYAGRTHGGIIFKPAAMVMSVKAQVDASAQSRDVENFNLTVLIKQHKLTGTGWGHEYPELIKAPDISRFFPQYLFIAHNSILWLLSIGGIVGFVLLTLPLVVGTFLATRSYRFARTPQQRTAATWVVAVIIAYLVQAWADMGTQAETISVILSLALATSAKLACDTGAWSNELPFFSGVGAARTRPVGAPARPIAASTRAVGSAVRPGATA